jgi:Straboviridae DNA primase
MDSATDTRKARGFLYDKEGSTYFFCHNLCGGMKFSTFIKRLDALLYQEWRMETLQSQGKTSPNEKEVDYGTNAAKRFAISEALSLFHRLPTIASLPDDHEGKRILQQRQIPESMQRTFRYSPGFKTFVNSILPGKFKDERTNNDGRIIIPFINADGVLHALQGRSVSPVEKQMRYICIVIDKNVPCLWGLDRIDFSQRVYVHEGVLDAIFIPNSLAIAGGNFASLQHLHCKDLVMVYDNEARSKDTKAKMIEAVEQDFGVCVWPSGLFSKDINDMIVKEGLTSDYIHYIIDKNIHHGLRAKAAITDWSKK